MKNYFLKMTLTLCILSLFSCNDNNSDNALEKKAIDLPSDTLLIEDIQGKSDFYIRTKDSWNILEKPDWCEVIPDHGTKSELVQIKAQKISTQTDRIGYINISGNQLKIVQRGLFIECNPDTIKFDKFNTATYIKIKSNSNWQFLLPEDLTWFTVSPLKGSGNSVVKVTPKSQEGDSQNKHIDLEIKLTEDLKEKVYISQSFSNNPPEKPALVAPSNQAYNVDPNYGFSWLACQDPDGDEVTYKLGYTTSPYDDKTWVYVNNLNTTSFFPDNLALNTTYYWKVIATDNSDNGSSESEMHSFQTAETESLADQFIKNRHFNQSMSFDNSQNWYTKPATAKVSISTNAGYSDNWGCVKIENAQKSDTRLMLKLSKLKPDVLYQIRAKVKTDNVTGGGANICVWPDWATTERITGTTDWKDISYNFIAPLNGMAEIAFGLGHYGDNNLASGTAYFDEIDIKESPDNVYNHVGKYIGFHIPTNLITINVDKIGEWTDKVDEIMVEYTNFFGRPSFGGRVNHILVQPSVPAWAYAGNPIIWSVGAVKSELEDYVKYNSLSFGILHELGHNYAPRESGENSTWNFNDELWANFRMAMALEKTGYGVQFGGKFYKGAGIIDYYKGSYDIFMKPDVTETGHDPLEYMLLRNAAKYSWDLYKYTFRYLYHMDENLKNMNAWEKFNFFTGIMKKVAKENLNQEVSIVPDFFSQEEWDNLKTKHFDKKY